MGKRSTIKRRAHPRMVKANRSYTVVALAERCGVHKNTVREWERHGLEPIDERRPAMFQGTVVQAFLKARRAAAKSPCPPGTIYCVSCGAPRRPALGMVDYIPLNPKTGNACAMCEACGTLMNRWAQEHLLPAIFPDCGIRKLEGNSRLSGGGSPPDNLHFKAEATKS